MTTPILLDPLIRDFVLIPIVVVVIMSNIIRMNLMQILGRATPKADPDEVKKQKLFTRVKLLRANGHFLTEKAFQSKKALYLKKDQGLLWQVPPQKNAMDAMMQAQSDPSMATGMMKNQFMFLGIHGTLGYWVSHLFSGFLVAKTPFPLTFKVKSMLQRGVDVPALDTSYVSSLSLYFFVSMSSQGIMQLYQQLRSSGDDASMAAAADTSGEDMMMMGGMMAPPPPPMPMGGGGDVKKAFETERENLDIVQHKFALEDAEARLLEKWLGAGDE